MKILVAEDDVATRESLQKALEIEGYEVLAVGNGSDALQEASTWQPDLFVLDVMMPRVDGIEVVRRLRDSGSETPILMLTAKSEVDDRIVGLDAGADDYMAKPYDIGELFARARALLRRKDKEEAGDEKLEAAGVVLDLPAHKAFVEGRELDLSKTEWSLLELLVRNSGTVLSRETIYDRIWHYDFGPESKNLNVYISYLRRKMEEGGEKRVLHTVRGVGYVIR